MFVSWRTTVLTTRGNFSTPVLASAARRTPVRCLMRLNAKRHAGGRSAFPPGCAISLENRCWRRPIVFTSPLILDVLPAAEMPAVSAPAALGVPARILCPRSSAFAVAENCRPPIW
ncbi:hypothetical protein KIF59_18880 [Enterobacter cloacae subsp. cloacae]|nr:hypothetical protein [Enterobacter cloacae subsp. cloacae]